MGVLDDTGFLQAAGPAQIRDVCELLPHIGGREADIAELFDPKPQPGERAAQLKATARARFYQARDVAVGVTHVGSFETAAAHALRGAGVDCALVWSDQGDHVRVVGRCSDAFAARLSLGSELLPTLGEAYGGGGGGHDGAAGARLNADPSQTDVTACIRRVVEDELGVKFATLGD
ncbi:DHHA1 domain-containing protein [Haloferax sp. AS1]|uniref:DHHA1 domain-containing protein n=1 Tax=Haloferax sp. AS1 TaxID=2562277 RepID=UPI00165F2986